MTCRVSAASSSVPLFIVSTWLLVETLLGLLSQISFYLGFISCHGQWCQWRCSLQSAAPVSHEHAGAESVRSWLTGCWGPKEIKTELYQLRGADLCPHRPDDDSETNAPTKSTTKDTATVVSCCVTKHLKSRACVRACVHMCMHMCMHMCVCVCSERVSDSCFSEAGMHLFSETLGQLFARGAELLIHPWHQYPVAEDELPAGQRCHW